MGEADWAALAELTPEALDEAVEELLEEPASSERLDLLHKLVFLPGYHLHQQVVFEIQAIGDPRSVPVLRQALNEGFERYGYTCSEDGVVAKWFSWALAAIGTPEARAVLTEFADSDNREVRDEMRYRLAKLSR